MARARFLVSLLLACATAIGCNAIFGIEPFQYDPDATFDASSDGPVVDGGTDADAPSCWPFVPNNVDPCQSGFDTAHPSTGVFSPDASSSIIDTNAAADTLGNVPFYRYDSFTIPAGATVTFQGTNPAIVLVDGTVDIEGTIVVSQTSVQDVLCATPNGAGSSNCGGGGGGGGYGGAGGNSGSGCIGTTQGGSPIGNVKLSPLRVGCAGGKSADSFALNHLIITGVTGGKAGGALQITAKSAITVGPSGGIFAAGGAGNGGSAMQAIDPNDCWVYGGKQTNHDCNTGGGGGGSGGAIFLESQTVTVAGNVCAVGGAGGGGGGLGGNGGGSGAVATGCVSPSGGNGGGGGGRGGDGGTVGDGGNGGNNGGNIFTSPGAGGGGSGRIRIRSTQTPFSDGGTVVPPPYTLP